MGETESSEAGDAGGGGESGVVDYVEGRCRGEGLRLLVSFERGGTGMT